MRNAYGFRPTMTSNADQIKESRGFFPLDLTRFYHLSLSTLFGKESIFHLYCFRLNNHIHRAKIKVVKPAYVAIELMFSPVLGSDL